MTTLLTSPKMDPDMHHHHSYLHFLPLGASQMILVGSELWFGHLKPGQMVMLAAAGSHAPAEVPDLHNI